MIISHEKRFLLMSPWKSASSTCHLRLEKYNESPYSRFFYFNKFLNRVVHQHLTISDLLSLPEGRLDYKIAAFVRNPYDRAYSGFIQIQRDFVEQPKIMVEPTWVTSLMRAQISENMARVVAAGYDFDQWIQLLPDYEIFEQGRNTNMVLHPCHYWTHVNSRQKADFIGKVENFESDFADFCKTISIDPPEVKSINISDVYDVENIGIYRYASKMSRKSLDRINDLFYEDFEIFEYKML